MASYRILLLGKTGNGKSSTGNSILGARIFRSELSASSVTQKWERGLGYVDGRAVQVLDGPGLMDTSRSREQIFSQLVSSLESLSPGPHAVLFVIKTSRRFSDEEYNAFMQIRNLTGDDILNYMIVVFTVGDELNRKRMSLDDFLATATAKLQEVIRLCGGRKCLFNNTFVEDMAFAGPEEKNLLHQRNSQQVQALFRMIGGGVFRPSFGANINAAAQKSYREEAMQNPVAREALTYVERPTQKMSKQETRRGKPRGGLVAGASLWGLATGASTVLSFLTGGAAAPLAAVCAANTFAWSVAAEKSKDDEI